MKHQKPPIVAVYNQNTTYNLYRLFPLAKQKGSHLSSERDDFMYVNCINDDYICDLGRLIKCLFRGGYSLIRDQDTVPNLAFFCSFINA